MVQTERDAKGAVLGSGGVYAENPEAFSRVHSVELSVRSGRMGVKQRVGTARPTICRSTHRAIMMLGLVALIGFGFGCTSSTIAETHYFAAYGRAQDTNFYRVRVDGKSSNSKLEYRSGLFPADAVDAVFGEVKPEGDPDARVRQLRVAVANTAKRYGELLASPTADNAKLEDARHKYNLALKELSQANSRAFDMPSKYIFVLSTDPGEVIQSIKDFLDQQQLAATLANLYQSSVVTDALVARERLVLVDTQRSASKAMVAAAQTNVNGISVEFGDDHTANDVDAVASGLATMASNLRLVSDALER